MDTTKKHADSHKPTDQHKPADQHKSVDPAIADTQAAGSDSPAAPLAPAKADKPAVDKAVTEKPAAVKADKPAVDKAVTEKPAADKAVTEKADKAVTEKADKAVTEKADKAVAEKADKPAVEKADKPAVEKADKPAVDKAVPEKPVAEKPAAPDGQQGHGDTPYIPYMQDRELSWLSFNERVLDQGSDPLTPLLERLTFVSIFSSNLQEFFMIRVGSLTDLSLLKKPIVDNKTGLTPAERLDLVYTRCKELYPIREQIFNEIRQGLAHEGIRHLEIDELDDAQREFLKAYLANNVMPVLSPQIINSRHPFPHLENGALYAIVRLGEPSTAPKGSQAKEKEKGLGAEGVTLGMIPLPKQCERIIVIPGPDFSFVLLENALELLIPEVFSMYNVKRTNVVCVTRNADLDAAEGIDEGDDDYREQMKKILKRRSRLAAVRLESRLPLSDTTKHFLLERLGLKEHQTFVTSVPLDMEYTYALKGRLDEKQYSAHTYPPFIPQWPATLKRNKTILEQVGKAEVLLSYPYESMDPFLQLLKEAANDPSVISIKITLYRLDSQSHMAETLIAAAENGKEVTALFELRARFDESNNIEWSQRFEQAGANVIYGFRDYKVHSKVCCITRQTKKGIQYITQFGTGNYNEKTARLYTDFAFITTNETFGRDAVKYFHNMGLEYISDDYDILRVAPLQIKPMLLAEINNQIERAGRGEACGLLFKTNSVTDKEIIEKLSEASQAGVPVTMIVRGICCLVPGVVGYTENIRVVSIVGRLLEHSRVYGFGPLDSMRLYLSSADLMTRNMERRIEVAWPVLNDDLRGRITEYLQTTLQDTAKLRELLPDGSYTPLGYFASLDSDGKKVLFDSQDYFIKEAQKQRLLAAQEEAKQQANKSRRASPEEQGPLMVEAAPTGAGDTRMTAKPKKQSLLARLLTLFRK